MMKQPLEYYKNPLSLQADLINEVQDVLLNDDSRIGMNSVFSVVTESFCDIVGNLSSKTCDNFQSLYPHRALISKDLYKHMSDYDYVNMFSGPAPCYVEIVLDKNYIILNAENYNENYKKVVFPKDSLFGLNQFQFRLYYPIEIRINRFSNTLHVLHDINTYGINPLHILTENTIQHRTVIYKGLELLSFQIPIYQFKYQELIEDVTNTTGFVKKYSFEDKFYAVRIYNLIDNNWVEIQQTFSDKIYDPNILTAKLLVDIQLHTLKVIIPQIYFTKKLVGKKIKIELHSTLGKMDADISNIAPENVRASFMTKDTNLKKYTNILNRIPTLSLYPVSAKINGGTDGYSFDELKNRVINDTFYHDVLITPDDLTKYFEDLNYKCLRYQDGITHRIYLCYNSITDFNTGTVPSGDLATYYTVTELENCDTVINNKDGKSYTILPETLYKYNTTKNFTTIVNNEEVKRIESLSKKEIVEEFNNNTYTYAPFYTKLYVDNKYPCAYSYDLAHPKIEAINFISENVNISSQMSVFDTQIQHIHTPTFWGYRLLLSVNVTKDLKKLDPSNLKIDVYTEIKGTKISTNALFLNIDSNRYIFETYLTTNYILSDDHKLEITSLYDDKNVNNYKLDLKFDLYLDFKAKLGNDSIPQEGYIFLSKQKLIVELGKYLPTIFNRVNLRYTDIKYVKYQTTEYCTYDSDQIKVDKDGIPIYEQKSIKVKTSVLSYTTTSNKVTIDNINNIIVGYYLNSVDFPYNSYITKIINNTTIEVSHKPIKSGTKVNTDIYKIELLLEIEHKIGDWIFDSETVLKKKATGTVKSNIITLNDMKDISNELYISGKGIDKRSQIVKILDKNQVQLDKPLIESITNSDVLIGIPHVKHLKGETILDEHGNPIIEEDRNDIFVTDKIHIDAKMFKAEKNTYSDFKNKVGSLITGYCDTVYSSKNQLIEQTKAFYKPLRSLGNGTFLRDEQQTQLSIEISIELKLYLYRAVYGNKKLQEEIKITCLDIIHRKLAKTNISMVDIGNTIKSELSDYVKYVDIVNVNNDANLQTLICVDKDIIPNLKRILVLDNDGRLMVKENLKLSYIAVN